MFYLQLFVPAGLVLVLFGLGHSFVRIDYSGVYFKEPVEQVAELESAVADGTLTQVQADSIIDGQDYMNAIKEKVRSGKFTKEQGQAEISEVQASLAVSLGALTEFLDEVTLAGVNDDGMGLLPDKYNYLKLETVFQGRLLDTKELFSLEVAIATKQANVLADFFIKSLYEIEADLVSETTKVVVDTTSEQLTSAEGRKILTDKIMVRLNDFLIEKDYRPDIHYVYIINHNII